MGWAVNYVGLAVNYKGSRMVSTSHTIVRWLPRMI